MTDQQRIMWAVSTGTYSDYRVMCVCPSEDDANTVASKFNASGDGWSPARAESFPIVSADVERHLVATFMENLWDDGRTTDRRENVRYVWPFDYGASEPSVRWRWVRAPNHQGQGGRLEVTGTDLERVRRVFSDKRAEIMATPALRMRKEARS